MLRSKWILVVGLLVWLVGCGDAPVVEPPPEASESAEALEPESEEPEVEAASNSAPRIEDLSFEPEEPAAGDTVRAVVETSDEDGDTVWLDYAWTIDGEPLEEESEEIVLEGSGFSRGDTLEVSVVASDGKDQVEDSASTELANAVPQIVSVEVLPAGELLSGAPITLRPDVRDADGDDLTFRYEWQVNGRSVRTDGPVLKSDRLRRGDTVQAQIFVADDDDESEPFETPLYTIANSPPRVVSRPGEPSKDGAFRYNVEAKDPDGDRNLQFHLENEPAGMKIDHLRGSIVWVPAPEQAGKHQVSVIVDDLRGGKTRHTFEVSVAAPDGAQPPASRGSGAQ
jgi:hypothetical protein